jgi:hypothetical protein
MWTLPQKVRDSIGIGNDEILDDRQIEEHIRMAQEQVKEELFTYHWGETVGCNPDTGDSWNGSNTKYRTTSYPIMDNNYDMVVDNNDITGHWVDENYTEQTALVTVSSATLGIITVTKTDASAIPSSAYDVTVDYYSCERGISKLLLENLTTWLSAHYVITTLKAGTSVSMTDLMKNEKIVLSDPNIYLYKYRQLLGQLQRNTIMGV